MAKSHRAPNFRENTSFLNFLKLLQWPPCPSKKRIFRHQKGYTLIPPVPGRPVNKNGTTSNVVGWFKFIFGGKDYLRHVKVKASLCQVKLKVKIKLKMKMKKNKMKMKHRRLGQND